MPLKGKTIVVTGATSGFGLACAKLFAKEGAKLVVCGRRKERLDELVKELAGQHVHAVVLDVRDKDAVAKAFSGIHADILINNAGLALGTAPFETQATDDLEQMVETNILGLMYCTQAVLPGMIARGSGHIVNIGSVAGTYPYPGGNAYGGTKAFVAQFSLNLRADLVDKNIRVTNVEPGMAETEFSLVRYHGDAGKAHAVYDGVTPLSAGDVAESVLWCITRPAHVNVNRIELMPTQQAFAGFAVNRNNK